MKSLIVITAVLVCCLTSVSARAMPNIYARKVKINEHGQKLMIQMSSQKFRPNGRKIEQKTDGIWVDNQRALGVGGTEIPKSELANISIKWNDKNVILERRAYSCIFDVPLAINIFPGNKDSTSVVLSEDGQTVLFIFSRQLGDSEATEQIYLSVTRLGKWTRFSYPYVRGNVVSGEF